MDEFEYHDTSKRSRWIILLGVALALVAGGGAFVLVQQAQSSAGEVAVQKAPVIVAARTIPGRKPIELADLTTREVPADLVAAGAVTDPNLLIGRVPAITILEGQVVTSNLLASSDVNGQFSILKPEETVTASSPYWRAVAITVPDDRAVAGLVTSGMTVDVFVTTTISVGLPADAQALAATKAGLYTDKATKIAYQALEVLAKAGTSYVVRVPIGVAEEIEHLQATGAAQFSLALRPAQDTRIADASRLGATTNLVIARYALPVPRMLDDSGVYTGSTRPFPIPTPAPITEASATTPSTPAP